MYTYIIYHLYVYTYTYIYIYTCISVFFRWNVYSETDLIFKDADFTGKTLDFHGFR